MVDMMARKVFFRAELDNSSYKWKLDSYVQIKSLEAKKRKVLSLPEEAVLQTGSSTRVWAQIAPGHFQPLMVEIGSKQDGRIEIKSGLTGDEAIVVSGTYLLDSDAQLKGFAGAHSQHLGRSAKSNEPEAKKGAPEVPQKPTQVKPVYTCPMDPQIVSDKPGKCPLCGMNLVLKGSE
jgi:Cu(I)/Ag(I) efflux system membrane fusion protein